MGDGVRVVCVWFWAPIMHRMSGRTLAWHFARCLWACTFEYPLWNCFFGCIVIDCTCVGQCEKRVFLFAWSVCVMRCTALLCLRPSRYVFSHVDKRCGYVSLSFFDIVCNLHVNTSI